MRCHYTFIHFFRYQMLNVEYRMSNVKCQISNVNKVKPFVRVYLRSFPGHFQLLPWQNRLNFCSRGQRSFTLTLWPFLPINDTNHWDFHRFLSIPKRRLFKLGHWRKISNSIELQCAAVIEGGHNLLLLGIEQSHWQ